MGLTQIHLLVVYSIAVALAVALTYVSGDDVILQSGRNPLVRDRLLDDNIPRKRPFCNAFAGCGGLKREDFKMPVKKLFDYSNRKQIDEAMASLLDLNSEPAVDELSKRILSEAKLSEAIQEARAEMEKQRGERQNLFERDLPLALAFSNRRKRSTTAQTTGSHREEHNER